MSLLSLKEHYIENGVVATIRFIVSMAPERPGDWAKCSRYPTTFLFFYLQMVFIKLLGK